jgi:hypothetical protein
MDSKFAKIVVFTPVTHADAVRKALTNAGAGHTGNYDNCSFSSRGVGRFRPLKGSKPFIGKEGVTEEVQEERIETILPVQIIEEVVNAVKEVHPYEEPAIDIYPMLNRS